MGPRDVKLFIKDEPHSLEKIKAKRYRLISTLAVEDQILDRWLFQEWHEAELEAVARCATKNGWAPLPLGFRDVRRAFPADVLNTDASSFDWTVPAWAVDELIEMRISQVRNPTPEYVNMVRNRYEEVLGSRCIVRLPDGTRYRQNRRGFMKSGWLRTLSDNSALQLMIHGLAYKRAYGKTPGELWVMGDDILMQWPAGQDKRPLVEELSALGLMVKRAGPERHFAGFEFEGDNVTPLYPLRHMLSLNRCPESDRQLLIDALAYIYAKSGDSVMKRWLDSNASMAPCYYHAWAEGLIGGQPSVTSYDVVLQWIQ